MGSALGSKWLDPTIMYIDCKFLGISYGDGLEKGLILKSPHLGDSAMTIQFFEL